MDRDRITLDERMLRAIAVTCERPASPLSACRPWHCPTCPGFMVHVPGAVVIGRVPRGRTGSADGR